MHAFGLKASSHLVPLRKFGSLHSGLKMWLSSPQHKAVVQESETGMKRQQTWGRQILRLGVRGSPRMWCFLRTCSFAFSTDCQVWFSAAHSQLVKSRGLRGATGTENLIILNQESGPSLRAAPRNQPEGLNPLDVSHTRLETSQQHRQNSCQKKGAMLT